MRLVYSHKRSHKTGSTYVIHGGIAPICHDFSKCYENSNFMPLRADFWGENGEERAITYKKGDGHVTIAGDWGEV